MAKKKINLNLGTIKTQQLVKLFGTEKQRERYKKEKRLNGKEKISILKKASKFCEIEDMGSGSYEIKRVYISRYDDKMLELKTGLYQYLAPSILNKLLIKNEEYTKISLSFFGWAKQFDIINSNYSFMKYNQDESSEHLCVDKAVMMEYFERVDDCIKGYLEKCLTILADPKTLNLIEYNKKRMIRFMIRNVVSDTDMNINCKYEDREATDDEIKFIIACEEKAMKKAGITSDKQEQKYYGTKSILYKQYYHELLAKKNMLMSYFVYDIFCKSRERVSTALSKFNTDNNLSKDFNDKFIDYVYHKAELRQKNEIQKYNESLANGGTIEFLKEHRLLDTYLDQIKTLIDTTININTADMSRYIDIPLESILKEFNIKINKN